MTPGDTQRVVEALLQAREARFRKGRTTRRLAG
jgi:hypothetical protein